jgi:hypothetical protein
MGSKLISNRAKRANNSPKANGHHGSRPLLARRQGQFCLQSGQQPGQPCFIWEYDPTTALGSRQDHRSPRIGLCPSTECRSRSSTSVFHPSSERPDCVAEVVGLELRNVVANYPFERSHRFVGIQPNSGHRDYARLGCGGGDTQLRLVLPASSGTVLRAPMSTLDAELNDFGPQLAMLGGHAADSDG